MEITEQVDLLLQQAAAAIPTAIMIAEDDRSRLLQARDGLGEAKISITQVADKQHGIRAQLIEQLSIGVTPLPVQVTGDGKA